MEVANGHDNYWLANMAGSEPEWTAPSEAGDGRRTLAPNLDDIDFNPPERAHRLDYIVRMVSVFVV
jgi:hypothetical protein